MERNAREPETMSILERLFLSPARRAGDIPRERAALAAYGSRGGLGWLGTSIVGLVGAAAGVAGAFLLDPSRGRARRARLVDQGAATVRRAGRHVEQLTRRVRADASGKLQAARADSDRVPRPTDDVTVTDRVRSELFRDSTVSKGSISVNVERGIVVLRGEIPDDAVRRTLVERVERIDGVWSVRDLLHLPGEPAPTREGVGSA